MSEKVSRREFLAATGAGLAAASGATANDQSESAGPDRLTRTSRHLSTRSATTSGPSTNTGCCERLGAIDQDAYEGTALMYRLVDRYGKDRDTDQ